MRLLNLILFLFSSIKVDQYNVGFFSCHLSHNNFKKVKSEGVIDLSTTVFLEFGILPFQLIVKPIRKAYFEQDEMDYIVKSGSINVRFSSLHSIDYFFNEISFYLKYCLEKNYLTDEEIISAFPTRKPKFKERIKEIVLEIKDTGEFEMKNYDDLPF